MTSTDDAGSGLLAPGSPDELAQFAALQTRLPGLFARLLPDPKAPRCVVVNPSLSLDPEVLTSIAGLPHYEERLLCMLLLLRLPRTRIVYLSSTPIDSSIVDYYLHLLPGVPGAHARKRLTMLSCQDPSTRQTLTEKLLGRPRLLRRVREAIGDVEFAHMSCFNATDKERTLAVRLGIPIYANDPALEHLGSKSGSRRLFRDAGVPMSAGAEGLRDDRDMSTALAELKSRDPALQRATVKLEYGTSGEGNALFDFSGAPEGGGLAAWVHREQATRLQFEDRSMTWERYRAKFGEMGGVVECWIEGARKRSPSVQCRITPGGEVEMISTHDQVLGGPSGQIFLGCTFPADAAYGLEIQQAGLAVADQLRQRGALGRFAVDFVSVPEGDAWRHYAIEVNLRKGGTTHTYRILQFLTDGVYDASTGQFVTPSGATRVYRASDNLESEAYRSLTPDDLMDIAVEHQLHFNATTQQGVFFHLIGALSGFGKLGIVCVADTPGAAGAMFDRTVAILDEESRTTHDG